MLWILLSACSDKECEVTVLPDTGIVIDVNDTDTNTDTDTGSDTGGDTGISDPNDDIDDDGDGMTENQGDCDDTDPSIFTGAPETCDGVDNNCSGDETDASDALTYFADTDADGFGDASSTTVACTVPNGFSVLDTDCDDTNPAINPGAVEYCDGIDENCSGDETDAIDPIAWYLDSDGDGFGEENGIQTNSCVSLSGYVENNTDCDDGNGDVNPGAFEICNDNLDSDCDTNLDAPVCSLSIQDLSLTLELENGYLFTAGGIGGDYDRNGSVETYWSIREFDSSVQLSSTQICAIDPLAVANDPFTPSDCLYEFTTSDSNYMFWSFPMPSHDAQKDLNGDGSDDMLIGLNRYNGTGVGAVAIITDPIDSSFDVNFPMTIIPNPESDGSFGSAIAYAGDVNDDGIGDILTSSPNSSLAASDAGAVYLIYGSGDLTTSQTITIVGDAGDKLGRGIATGDDINGDGIDDLVIGAYKDDYVDGVGQTTIDTGAGYVFFGPLTQDTSSADADQTIYGSDPVDKIGNTIDTSRDFDGDGLADVMLGSHYANKNGLNQSGMAIVVTDSTNPVILSSEAHLQVSGQNESDRMGRNIMSLGDINSDGFDDIAISAKDTDYLESNGGSVHVFYGPRTGVVTPENANVIISGTQDSQFGINLNKSPDVDGDGFDEMIIGSYHYASTQVAETSGLIWSSELY